MKETEVDILEAPGAFMESLVRTNKDIKRDRAEALHGDAQLFYKREVEDLAVRIKKLIRDRDAALDLSPSDKNSLVLPTTFSGKDFAVNDMKLSIDIRNLQIQLEVSQKRFEFLFGGKAGI